MLIETNKLSLGILFPIEAYEGAIPKMDRDTQIRLAQKAEENGFHTLWVRDVPLHDPNFRDVGQIFDPWIYMAHIASLTKTIKIGAASMVLPLRHPIHFAKAAASLDVLFPDRLHLGVASGDRALEYPAFAKPYETRSTDFNLDWIAINGDGWIYYPREFSYTKNIIQNWKDILDRLHQPRKPYIQPLYIDLLEDPNAEPIALDLGFRLGRNYFIDLLQTLQYMGVNHGIFIAKFCSRPLDEVIEEIGKEVIPHIND